MAITSPPAPRRWVLRIIVLLLVSSGVLRLTGETGRVLAREVEDLSAPEIEMATEAPLMCPPGTEMAEMMIAINQREASLEQRQAELKVFEEEIARSKLEIEASILNMVETEQALAATMATANSAAENDLSKLTSLYENMKPQDAAALFSEMDPEFSSGFLARMRPEAAASVLAGLEPQKAYAISVILAGRNADVPTN